MRNALLALALSLLTGCAVGRSTDNEPLEAAQLQSLRPGTTTAQEVVQMLGAPVDVVQLGRRSAYRYQFTATKRSVLFLVVVNLYNEDTRADRAWLFFDENQVLTHMGTTLEAEDVEYAMPWEDIHG
jgi:outer membrane protein assembly factor BamE (lipoprotein component of BamABCDE complex)